MKSDIVFEERQCFAERSLRNSFLVLTGFFFASILIRLFLVSEGEDNWVMSVLIAGLLFSAILSLFLSNCLITQITVDGIYIRFPPFMPSEQAFLWKDIQEVYIIKYKPITQYGGWGIRIGPYGRAFNISSTTGLQVIFKDSSRLLIGTKQPEKLIAVLRKLGKMN